MNILEAMDYVAKEAKKRKLTMKEMDDAIYYLLQDHYKQKPPTFREYLENPMYVPGVLETMYPIWLETFDKLYPSIFYNPYYLILLYASTGSGKSTAVKLIAGYELVKLLCLKNPLQTYNLGTTDIIYIDFHLPSLKMAGQTNYAQFLNLLNSSPFFLKEVNVPSASSDYGRLTQHIALQAITCIEDTVSKAVFFVGMDEFNEKKSSNVKNEGIYNSLDRRMEGRFMNTYGYVPYKFVVASSPKDSSDELSTLAAKLDTLSTYGNRRAYKTGHIPQWLTRGCNLAYSGKKFGVYLGDEYSEPSLIMEGDKIPDSMDFEKIEYVPIEYLRSFQQDIIGSIQDILGISTNRSGKLYANRSYIEACYCQENLFTQDTVSIPFNIGLEAGINLLASYFDFNKIKFPEYQRAIHVDVGLTGDRLGFSGCFMIPTTQVKVDGTGIFKDYTYISDFCVGLESHSSEQIPLDVVAGFIAELDKKGYPVGLVTYDGFQSAAISQPLERRKIPNRLQSMDRTKDPYLIHKRAVLQTRFLAPKNKLVIEEFANLLNLPTKIDHPSDGCFTGDTKIALVDGRKISIMELLEEQKYKENWVYTINETTHRIEPKPIKKVFQTKLVKELLKITLDTGEQIFCTPEHRFMLRDGSFLQAKKLKEGISLMPLYTKLGKGALEGYRLYYEPMEDKWHYEHQQFCQGNRKNKIVHHCNYNKEDNTPPNLKIMTREEHQRIHNNSTMDYDKISKAVKEYHKKAKGTIEYSIRNKKLSEIGKKKWWSSLNSKEKKQWYIKKFVELLKVYVKYKIVINKLQTKEVLKDKSIVHSIFKGTNVTKHRAFIHQLEDYYKIDYYSLSPSEKNSYSNKFLRILNPELVKSIAQKVSENHKKGKYKKIQEVIRQKRWITNGIENRYIFKTEELPNGFWYGRTFSKETINKMREVNSHKNWTKEQKEALSKKHSIDTSNRMWITNGVDNKYIPKTSSIPEGFYKGRSGYWRAGMKKQKKNHKVLSIQKVTQPCKVYDIEVKDNHNFALAAGVFVHNSKDLSDSQAGAFFGCYMNEQELLKNRKVLKAMRSSQVTSLKERLRKAGLAYYS